MMNTLLGMGLAGGAVLALWLLTSRILKNRLPARWHYRILKTSLFFFLVPVGRLLPLVGQALSALRPAPAAPMPAPAVPHVPVTVFPQAPVTVPIAPAVPQISAPEPFSVTAEALRALAVVWAVGAAATLSYKLYVYLRLRRQVFRQNRPVSSREAQLMFWSRKRALGIRGPVELRENPAARSPFAAGLLRPMVVVPSAGLEREELRYLFSHELTHIKCGDLWVRFAAMLAQVIHWYNPLVYVLSRSIQAVSEQSCDERVASPLSKEERYVYGNVILKSAAGATVWSGDWAASLSTRESIERRLIRVLKTEKLRGSKRLLALALALVILTCGGGAALAARNPLPVSREAREPARTVTTLPAEGEDKGGASAANPGDAKPESVPVHAIPSVTAPTQAQVLAAREQALTGMTKQQIQTLTETIQIANLCLEGGYLYDNIFGKLEDPDSLTWNYFDKTGEIQIGWAYDGELDMEAVCRRDNLTEDEFYARYGTRVVTTNRYDARFFIDRMTALSGSVQNETLKADLRYLMDEMALARETHAMEHANNLYKKLHDLDYFLLRYGPTDVGEFVEDASTVSKYYGTLSYYDAAEPEDKPEADRPVTTNGTPSEAFLKELRAYFSDKLHVPGITEDTPVLFGDHELILKRGGTLLPDEEFSSYTCAYGGSENLPPVIYKEFHTKPHADRDNSVGYTSSEEYYVGNKEALAEFKLKLLDELVNGEYPKNSKGESYGSESFGRYVGYYPDLVSARGTRGESGYIYRPDESSVPCNLPKDECPHEFLIPLYDREHNEIGKFEMCCGGHFMQDVIAKNMTVEEAKAALASGELSYAAPTYDDPSEETLAKIREAWEVPADTPVLFGDKDLILSRGGTLQPDDAPSSYMMSGDTLYKEFHGKDGCDYVEYKVGNVEVLSESARKLAERQLVNGDYPRNSKVETYGSTGLLANFVGYAPDLIAAVGVDGVEGYIRERDQLGYALRKAHDIEGYMALLKANPGPQPIPLYDSEGAVIGAFMHGGGSSNDELGLQGMSIEEAKAAVAAMFDAEDAE